MEDEALISAALCDETRRIARDDLESSVEAFLVTRDVEGEFNFVGMNTSEDLFGYLIKVLYKIQTSIHEEDNA